MQRHFCISNEPLRGISRALRRSVTPVVLLCLGFLYASPARAQKLFFVPDNMWVGATAGASGSMLLFNPYLAQDIYWGYYAGAEFLHTNQKYTGLRVQLGYAKRGTRDLPPDEGDGTFSINLDIVEAALLCHLYYPVGSVDLGFDLGPAVGVIAGFRATEQGSGFVASQQERHALTLNSRFSWGLKAGPSVGVHIQNHLIMLSAQGYYGFNNIYRARQTDLFTRSGEVGASVTLSYFFSFLNR